MACSKCEYKDKKEHLIFDKPLCSICAVFAPKEESLFKEYLSEKLDWKCLDTFRKYHQSLGLAQKEGMINSASLGKLVTRAPLGYSVVNGRLIANEDSTKVHSLFKTFLSRNYSLNSLAKNYGVSLNGIKKILTNRTYLGEIKFDRKIYHANHKPIISAEIFYAVQRKLKEYLRPRNKI